MRNYRPCQCSNGNISHLLFNNGWQLLIKVDRVHYHPKSSKNRESWSPLVARLELAKICPHHRNTASNPAILDENILREKLRLTQHHSENGVWGKNRSLGWNLILRLQQHWQPWGRKFLWKLFILWPALTHIALIRTTLRPMLLSANDPHMYPPEFTKIKRIYSDPNQSTTYHHSDKQNRRQPSFSGRR